MHKLRGWLDDGLYGSFQHIFNINFQHEILYIVKGMVP